MMAFEVVCRELNDKGALYWAVKASFVVKGDTLGAWCKRNGVSQANVKQCLVGAWEGPKALTLKNKVISESGVKGVENVTN